jgi:CheY-like chemotaxis protein
MGAMTMFVLVVEDEPKFIEELRRIFNDLSSSVSITVAKSRAAAFDAIALSFYDLVVLDLKIPTIDGALDADPQHGHAVFARMRSEIPGTPIFVLTGSPVENFVQPMLSQQQQVDIWGQGQKIGNLNFLQKFRLDECPGRLQPIVQAVLSLADVELIRTNCELSIDTDRLIRIFAKRAGGACCHVHLLSGGLSEAKVARLRVTDTAGVLLHDAIAKLGSGAQIQSEGERFDRLVARLDSSATPRKLATLEFGAGAQAGNFYSLARGFEFSAFEIATSTDGLASATIQSVEMATKPWLDGVGQSRRSIREVRQRLLTDELARKLSTEFGVHWSTDFEALNIQTRWACIHGDLHGSNILVSPNGATVLIDYSDVGEGTASLDPVMLELSLIFHPLGPLRGQWPTIEEAHRWGDLDTYIAACPAAEFVRECRNWAGRVAPGQREIAASAYAYLLRQLKYDDTDKQLLLALLEGVYTHYTAT